MFVRQQVGDDQFYRVQPENNSRCVFRPTRFRHVVVANPHGGSCGEFSYLAIPVQSETYLFTVCRYVEQNPVRAGLVERASEWRWSSASSRPGALLPPLANWPVPRPLDWRATVDGPPPASEASRVRDCLMRSAPLSDEEWSENLASRLGWRTGLRRPGRPRSREVE